MGLSSTVLANTTIQNLSNRMHPIQSLVVKTRSGKTKTGRSFHVKSTSNQKVFLYTKSNFAKTFTHWYTVQIMLFLIFSDFYVISDLLIDF